MSFHEWLTRFIPMSSQSLNSRLDNLFLNIENLHTDEKQEIKSIRKDLCEQLESLQTVNERKNAEINSDLKKTENLIRSEMKVEINGLRSKVSNETVNISNQVDMLMKMLRGAEQKQIETQTIVKELQQKLATMEKKLQTLEKNDCDIKKLSYNHLNPNLYAHAVKQWYQDTTGNILDLDNPKTYNEKIQWMKVYDQDPIKTLLADKYLVREWVKEKIGEEYLIPLLSVYRTAEEINFDSLPDSFVLKANHGCGMNAIVRNKQEENLEAVRSHARSWLSKNYAFNFGYELQYNDIPRRLIAEQYLENMDGDMPDFKFWCFDGKCYFTELITGRRSISGPHLGFFSNDWELLPFSTGVYPRIKEHIQKPAHFEKMIEIAETLSDGFPHVRVDLYLLDNGSIKFGEMTFTTSSGVNHWDPPEADLWVGEMLNLPQKKNK